MDLILTIFDTHLGPKIFISIPEDTSNEKLEVMLSDFLNLELGETFFEINIIEENLKTFNLYIEIPSRIARGGTEMVLLSLITEKNYKSSLFYDILKNTQKKMIKRSDLYKAFYMDSMLSDDLSKVKYEELKDIMVDTFEECKSAISRSTIGNILILGINKVGKTSIRYHAFHDIQ